MRDDRGRRPNQPASQQTGRHGGGPRTEPPEPSSDALIAPLPTSARERAAKAEHPGLWLDKYAETWNGSSFKSRDEVKLSETVQKRALQRVVELTRQAAVRAGNGFAAAAERHRAMLDAMDARLFTATTAGPLTLHLKRASALENAGLALHPLYGFAYLPGSGLKGMARAYAEAVWLPSLPEAERPTAWRQIEDVFGWAPTPERRKRIREHPDQHRFRYDDSARGELTASTGQIVFHDAWPEQWPALLVDIVNNHHPAYYEADEKKEAVPPPGDWENPRPVYFLAVKPGTRFRFALAPARRDTAAALVDQAEAWLLGALVHEGAGAKTAAGYGRFRADEAEVQARTPKLPEETRAVFEAELELVTPAFLAGGSQDEKDCDLRPATLRGVLRWWWRTLHAGFLEPAELRRLETAIWGSAEVGGALRIAVEVANQRTPAQPEKNLFRPNTGLGYIGYGVAERFYQPSGASWQVRLTARASILPPAVSKGQQIPIPDEQVLDQARAALWLLCNFGGVGSKARKGFGSLMVPLSLAGFSLETVRVQARQFRAACGLADQPLAAPLSPSFDDRQCLRVEIETDWTDPWIMIEQMGQAVRIFTRDRLKDLRKVDRRALGLPRRQRGVDLNQFPLGPHTRQTDRHAAPVHIHLSADDAGYLTVRLLAFPAPELPAGDGGMRSRRVLKEYLEFVSNDLWERNDTAE